MSVLKNVLATINTQHCCDEDDEILVNATVYGGRGQIDEIALEVAHCCGCGEEVILTERDHLRAEDAIERRVAEI